MSAGIPVLDFDAWRSPGPERDRLVKQVGDGLAEFGFIALTGHGIDDGLIQRCYEQAARTFALPDDVKRRHEHPEQGRERGYTSFGVEHARDRGVADLKEFWHVGREGGVGLAANDFPVEVPGFAEAFSSLFGAMDVFSREVLEVVGAWLELPPGWFDERVRTGNSVLRIIHYPPLVGDVPPGAIRAAQHEDINLMTVLPVSTEPGLEILTRDGRWVSVQPPSGAMVVDTGDMMQLLTRGRLPATTHRVVNPSDHPDRSRYSMPFFVHPHPDVRLDPLGGTQQGITAGEFLRRRLVEIGVA